MWVMLSPGPAGDVTCEAKSQKVTQPHGFLGTFFCYSQVPSGELAQARPQVNCSPFAETDLERTPTPATIQLQGFAKPTFCQVQLTPEFWEVRSDFFFICLLFAALTILKLTP